MTEPDWPIDPLTTQVMTHEILCQRSANDLRLIVKHLNEKADQIEKGDINLYNDLLDDGLLSMREMAILRYSAASEAKAAGKSLKAFLEHHHEQPT